MEFLRTSPQMCPRDKQCSQWARKYLKYCLCSTKDGVSFSLGLISVFSWGIAEIPQILTNYKEKSAEGLSIAFLMTWVVGDFLNLFGCMLEPATLPTQYYTAMLYTITTLVLVTQAIYFGHIYPRLKLNRQTEAVEEKRQHNHEVDKEKGGSKSPRSGVALSSPIPLPTDSHAGSIERELYYKSARSLSRSHTPPVGFHMHKRRSAIEEPLLSEQVSLQSNGGNTKSMLCVVSAGAFFLGTFYLPLKQNPRIDMAPQIRNRGIVLKVGRRLLQGKGSLMPENGSTENGGIGTFLGWGMAAIYVGGRLPQICLNFRRGNVEGLNPYMFIFALIGNATYVARLHILGKEVSFDSFLQQLISFIILVNSLEWSKIRPNLPWLVDAGGCVILDTFILIQFIFFHCRTRRQIKHGNSSAN